MARRYITRYAEIVNGFIVPALGKLPLTKLAPVHIQEAHNTWAADGGRRYAKPGGLSRRTRRHIHRIFSAALARPVEQQLVARNA